jgi:hypothetical protein
MVHENPRCSPIDFYNLKIIIKFQYIIHKCGDTMPTEEQIRALAYSIWELEGHPPGKDVEHYYRAKSILEEQKTAKLAELAAPYPKKELEMPTPITELAPPASKRRRPKKK